MQFPSKGGKKIYIFGPGHMTKMATMPIYRKILRKSSPEPLGRFLETLYVASGELVH